MGLYEVQYSEYVQEFYTAQIEADSEEDAEKKFWDFDRAKDGIYESVVIDHCEIEQILKIE